MARWKRTALAIGAGLVVLGLAGVLVPVALRVAQERRFQGRVAVKVALTAAGELRRAAEWWREQHRSDACVTVDRLKRDGAIDPASRIEDPWGAPFQIVCHDGGIVVASRGPDGVAGTADDIRVPEEGARPAPRR